MAQYLVSFSGSPVFSFLLCGVVITSHVTNSKSLASLGALDFGVSLKPRAPSIPIPLICVVVCALLMWSITAFNNPLYQPHIRAVFGFGVKLDAQVL